MTHSPGPNTHKYSSHAGLKDFRGFQLGFSVSNFGKYNTTLGHKSWNLSFTINFASNYYRFSELAAAHEFFSDFISDSNYRQLIECPKFS